MREEKVRRKALFIRHLPNLNITHTAVFHAYPVDATSATPVSFGWRHSPRYKSSNVGTSIRTPIPSTELNAVIG